MNSSRLLKRALKGALEAMDGYGVTIRTLTHRFHEFVPTRLEEREN